MKKITSLFAITALALVFPACAKKTTKQEPVKVEKTETIESVAEKASNDKENYTV